MTPSARPDAQGASGADDLDLVRATLRRERAGIEHFVERMKCIPRMLAVRNARTGSPLASVELEDLSQDVVTLVWRKLEAFEGRARLETWVYQFCYLAFLGRMRARRAPRTPGATRSSRCFWPSLSTSPTDETFHPSQSEPSMPKRSIRIPISCL